MTTAFKPRKIDFKKIRSSSRTVPEQSFTINEIVAKYTRGIPVNVRMQTPVYSDQTEFDLEKLNRMEFDEKHALAKELQEERDNKIAQAQERAKQANEARVSQQRETDESDPEEASPKKRERSSRKNPPEQGGTGNPNT